MNAKSNPQVAKAAKFAAKLAKNYGPVTVVRAVAQEFRSLKRRDVLAVAEKLNINKSTAARQYQEVRGPNKVRVTGLSH